MSSRIAFALALMLTALVFGGVASPALGVPPTAEQAFQALETWIERERQDKEIPSIAIAIVDDQKVVWSKGFGLQDPDRKIPATAQSIYRVGSVSKLFADLAVMRLHEQGKLDIDAPIQHYLPKFQPKNPFAPAQAKPITLRNIMSHRSGLVRETPIGSYFDAEPPPLADVVASLNTTSLVFPTETRTKYSNAAITVAGFVVQELRGEPFPQVVSDEILKPLGMNRSGFLRDPKWESDIAKAVMWTYHGRTFPAPIFDFGIGPAGNLYASVEDIGKFLSALFRDGGGIVKPETLKAMYKPQSPGGEFGLGFAVGSYEGKLRVGHGGAVYGYATDVSALPDEKLGVVVVCAKDCANTMSRRIANMALSSMLAVKQSKSLPQLALSDAVTSRQVRELAGYYTDGTRTIELMPETDRFVGIPRTGDRWLNLRSQGGSLIIDGPLGHNGTIMPLENAIVYDGKRLDKTLPDKPKDAPDRWRRWIGEYGWDHNILYLFEHEGQPYALIEWFFLYPLTEESENVLAFPDHGLYEGEKIVLKINDQGRAIEALTASVPFPRRKIDGENGETFRVRPVRPIPDLLKEALQQKPPEEADDKLKPDLVDLTTLDSTIKLDIRYASDNNFLSTPLYPKPKALMQKPAAEALVKAHRWLKPHGYGLLIHDAYRPWHITKVFWDAVETRHRGFVANPQKGSKHNRGCAVDLSLYDLKTGKPVDMVGGYDEFSDRAAPLYPGGTSLQRWHRRLLWKAMHEQNFSVNEAEWWHFDYQDWAKYPISNVAF